MNHAEKFWLLTLLNIIVFVLLTIFVANGFIILVFFNPLAYIIIKYMKESSHQTSTSLSVKEIKNE